MAKSKEGRQTPTQSVVLPYKDTRGQEAIELYNSIGNMAMKWQELQLKACDASNAHCIYSSQTVYKPFYSLKILPV